MTANFIQDFELQTLFLNAINMPDGFMKYVIDYSIPSDIKIKQFFG